MHLCKSEEELKIAFHANDTGFLIIGGGNGDIYRLNLHKIPEGTISKPKAVPPFLHTLDDHEGSITCLDANLIDSDFISGSWDGCVRVWKYSLDEFTWISFPLKAHTGHGETARCKITAAKYSSDGAFIVAATASEALASIYVRLHF